MPDAADMTVLQASAYEIGGAGAVMLDLHREYMRRDIDSWVAVGRARHADARVLEVPNDAARSGWTRAVTRLAGAGAGEDERALSPLAKALLVAADPGRYQAILAGVEDFAFPATAALLDLPPRRPNVLHLHNLHGYYFDLRELPVLSRQVPTVLTMHDAWLLTGHCAHPIDCPRWEDGCGMCPDLERYVPIRADASAENRRLKREILGRSRVALVSPSRWLLGMAEHSLPLGNELTARHIPNGVDTSVFRPGDRVAARTALELAPDATVLLATAEMLADNPFKDFPTLRSALEMLGARDGSRPTLVALGLDREIDPIPGVDVVAVPFTDGRESVVRHYQAADVYVHAARAENLPITILEAMACGLPVVASAVGGIPELVVEGETGLLVPRGDAGALADALAGLLGDAERRAALGRAGRARVLEHFTLSREADRYLELYAELRGLWSAAV